MEYSRGVQPKLVYWPQISFFLKIWAAIYQKLEENRSKYWFFFKFWIRFGPHKKISGPQVGRLWSIQWIEKFTLNKFWNSHQTSWQKKWKKLWSRKSFIHLHFWNFQTFLHVLFPRKVFNNKQTKHKNNFKHFHKRRVVSSYFSYLEF